MNCLSSADLNEKRNCPLTVEAMLAHSACLV
jgi:hypothetical protein